MINYSHALRRARAMVKKHTVTGNAAIAAVYQTEVNKLKLLIRVQEGELV